MTVIISNCNINIIIVIIIIIIIIIIVIILTEVRGGEGAADWDTAASNRSTCLELLDREPFA